MFGTTGWGFWRQNLMLGAGVLVAFGLLISGLADAGVFAKQYKMTHAASMKTVKVCMEDQSCWNCHTMGNKICGRVKHEDQPGWNCHKDGNKRCGPVKAKLKHSKKKKSTWVCKHLEYDGPENDRVKDAVEELQACYNRKTGEMKIK